jgi:hypothetical protein
VRSGGEHVRAGPRSAAPRGRQPDPASPGNLVHDHPEERLADLALREKRRTEEAGQRAKVECP